MPELRTRKPFIHLLYLLINYLRIEASSAHEARQRRRATLGLLRPSDGWVGESRRSPGTEAVPAPFDPLWTGGAPKPSAERRATRGTFCNTNDFWCLLCLLRLTA
jgi:hypothetical protein